MTWWEYGDPAGAPVLALHGMGATGRMYAPHDAFFRAKGLRCLAPNLVGGLADPAPGSRLRDLGSTATELMTHLGIDRFTIVASSYGTLVALGVIAVARQRVTQAGLFGALVPGAWLTPELIEGARSNDVSLWTTARKRPWLLYPMTALFGLAPTAAKIRSFLDPKLPETERAMLQPGHPFHAEFGKQLEECGQRGYAFMAFGVEVGWGRDPGFTLEELAAADVPVFLCTGELDNGHPPAQARYLAERLPRARLELVPGQGRFAVMGPQLEEGMTRMLR